MILLAFKTSLLPNAAVNSKLLKSLLMPIFFSMSSAVMVLPAVVLIANLESSLATLDKSLPKNSGISAAALGSIFKFKLCTYFCTQSAI